MLFLRFLFFLYCHTGFTQIIWKIKPIFDEVEMVMLANEYLSVAKIKNKEGMVNLKTGKIIIPLKYEKVERKFGNTILESFWIKVKINGKYGLVDTLHKTILKPKYKEIHHLDNFVFFKNTYNKWGLANNKGKIMIKPMFETWGCIEGMQGFFVKDFEGIIYKLKKDFALEISTNKGKLDAYDDNYCNSPLFSKEDRIDYKLLHPKKSEKTGKYGFGLRSNLNYVIEPIYDSVDYFHGKVAWVQKDKKWGLINQQGIFLIPFEFDNIDSFMNLYTWVKKGKKWGLIKNPK